VGLESKHHDHFDHEQFQAASQKKENPTGSRISFPDMGSIGSVFQRFGGFFEDKKQKSKNTNNAGLNE
jgi:hypothetical protein